MITKWHKRFMRLALDISTWSKDPSSQVGAIAVDDERQIVSVGYNGFPMGIDDSEYRYNDRKIKYGLVVHAEQNLIYNASRRGVSIQGTVVYVTTLPVCNECAKGMIQAGVKKIFLEERSFNNMHSDHRWKESTQIAMQMFDEAGITVSYV